MDIEIRDTATLESKKKNFTVTITCTALSIISMLGSAKCLALL